jgi:2-polyprenyl-3-methyl-5-hydroxy-6-metoxy-1,4-benzoquinol methylase|tara:strand:- start:24 stop:1247 length:1224 start_codon:yes stop_codon:yes gene_type:complete
MTKIPKTKKIKKCRLCNSKKLINIHNFGNHYVSNFVTKRNVKKGVKAPLNLVYCNNCKLLQLEHSAPQEIMYKKFYWYRSGVTNTMKYALKDIFLKVKKMPLLKKGDTILDIGANDGTLLKYFKNDGYTTIGCEPAKNLTNELKKNSNYVIDNFWNYKYLRNILNKHKLNKPKVITAIGMFYDLEDPSKFISDAANSLDENGVFIAQLMCLNSMIKKNDLGNICHEHLEFYSYPSLKFLFEKNGFKIMKIEENEINGGSYRIFCKKNIKKSIAYREKTSLSDIKKFIKRVKQNKKKCLSFLRKCKVNGKKVFIYGASTKGNTLLQYYGIDFKMISFASERSPEKWGKYTIGTGVEIISEEYARKLNPEYFFVMPYAFIKEFVIREKKWLKKGGKFILPFPNFKILNN